MPFPLLTPAIARDALASAGVLLPVAEIALDAHDNRWLARLPQQRLAWFAASDEGRAQLITERRVLALVASRCTFRTPRVLLEDPTGDFDVRSMVPGNADPFGLYAAICKDEEVAGCVGSDIGAMLAEQHTRIRPSDIESWLPNRPYWPEPRAWVCERLPSVVNDAELIAAADDILVAYESVAAAEDDRVLAHADLGVHNMSFDPVSHRVQGIFDYDGAVCADRHHDFRYLLFDNDSTALLDSAISAYEPVVGCTIQRERVYLYQAACAVTFLAFRIGKSPEDPWCGRTLAEDLKWSRHAIRAYRRILRMPG
jgi:hypothetical protein